MTEAEWLASDDPRKMLDVLNGSASKRKLRLFACACWHVSSSHSSRWCRAAVEVSEAFADGRAGREDLLRVWRRTKKPPRTAALYDAFKAATRAIHHYDIYTHNRLHPTNPTSLYPPCLLLFRDVFANPFRRPPFDPAWRTDTARALTRQMYESRDFTAAPILADALQDAGCDYDDLLNHLRNPEAVHVRGCWAVDLVLEKL